MSEAVIGISSSGPGAGFQTAAQLLARQHQCVAQVCMCVCMYECVVRGLVGGGGGGDGRRQKPSPWPKYRGQGGCWGGAAGCLLFGLSASIEFHLLGYPPVFQPHSIIQPSSPPPPSPQARFPDHVRAFLH